MPALTRTESDKMQKRDTILAAAESLFLERGFRETSMNDLAEKSGLTKKTVYAYFIGKEDVYFCVIGRWYENLLLKLGEASKGTGTAMDRIVAGCGKYVALYEKNPVIFSMMNSLQSVRFSGDTGNLPGHVSLMETKKALFRLLYELFDAGKQEGSIRGDMETPSLVASFIFNLTGFFYMLSSSGKAYTGYFKLREKTFIRDSVQLLVDSIKKERE